MDRNGTLYETVNVVSLGPTRVPQNGFEWVEGVRAPYPEEWYGQQIPEDTPLATGDFLKTGLFLVARHGPTIQAKVPPDLYLEFSGLGLDPTEILRFAEQHGPLRTLSLHFHPISGKQTDCGEDFQDWQIQIRRLKNALDLWYAAEDKDLLWVNRFLKARSNAGPGSVLSWPSFLTAEEHMRLRGARPPKRTPLELAKEIVRESVNVQLFPYSATPFDDHCFFSKCGHEQARQDWMNSVFGNPTRKSWSNDTRAYLRESKTGQADLVITASNLLKTIWLQFAGAVAGQRKVKKCAAPDCGLYMDVTMSPHPMARLMHNSCAERIRKRRYREKLKHDEKRKV